MQLGEGDGLGGGELADGDGLGDGVPLADAEGLGVGVPLADGAKLADRGLALEAEPCFCVPAGLVPPGDAPGY